LTTNAPSPDDGAETSSVSLASRAKDAAAVVTVGLSAAGCGGGGSGGGGAPASSIPLPSQPAAPAVTDDSEAARFLVQATFGPTEEEINNLARSGYDAWLAEQFNQSVTRQTDRTSGRASEERIEAWWYNAVRGPDQLRQRMAFALSQIFVVSEVDLSGQERNVGLASYYDMLAENAFGTYRDLLERVTLHPIMGEYLSMVRNEKPDAAKNIRPDENYAREVMQLFSIGLVRLSLDGTVPNASQGGDPTYTQDDIEGLAHVFTGWNYAGSPSWKSSHRNYIDPMEPNEDFHDTATKVIVGGVTIPDGGTAEVDLRLALDALERHPNVAPFMSEQLIKRLVTSNPSRAYVQRVAQIWLSDERGDRGNLASVARAILLDPEAREGHRTGGNSFGKLREPLLRQTALWRAMGATSASGRYPYSRPERDFGQAPLRSPSVFNFFRPDFQQPGDLAGASLDSPEFAILTESAVVSTTNQLHTSVFRNHSDATNRGPNDVLLQLDAAKAYAADPTALVGFLNRILMAGQMSAAMRTSLISYLIPISDADGGTDRVLEALYLIVSSPEFALQR
jgi:uncharacterized protein (DUF1800 family)